MTATKTRREPVDVVRYRTPCPACGYGLAMADTGRDEIHCPCCHRSSAIPAPVVETPPDALVSGQLQQGVDANGPGVYVRRTAANEFVVEYDGAEYAVAVVPVG